MECVATLTEVGDQQPKLKSSQCLTQSRNIVDERLEKWVKKKNQ